MRKATLTIAKFRKIIVKIWRFMRGKCQITRQIVMITLTKTRKMKRVLTLGKADLAINCSRLLSRKLSTVGRVSTEVAAAARHNYFCTYIESGAIKKGAKLGCSSNSGGT